MSPPLHLDPERFFPAEPHTRAIAARLFKVVEDLPIVSPHGHTDPAWFATDAAFSDAVSLLLWPDHYVLRMLMSAGLSFESLGIAPLGSAPAESDLRLIWRRFAENYRLFRATPSRLWLDHVFAEVFGFEIRLDRDSADHYFDSINAALATPEFRPRALYERFNIEVLATTEPALDSLEHHRAIRASSFKGRVISTFRPDDVIDADRPEFPGNIRRLSELTGEDCRRWQGYLEALRQRRAFFRAHGASATDHGHPTARTLDLSPSGAEKLFGKIVEGGASSAETELFRAQMLTEMARMSLEDGMVMQLHAGAWRNHNDSLYQRFGRDRGGDVPMQTNFNEALKPLLDRFGGRSDLTLILFTLDESTYSRELAPLAGHYPCLKLGPPWWFHDAPEAMLRYRRAVTETAGFYNTCGFNDDTRAFLSIPARHDLARRLDCTYLAELVATRRLEEDEAAELAIDLAYRLAKAAYRL
ncbi:MAG TPA: glucuronate isomerase [Steroidobacteraceae bacterium]|jgi:glucuronate isomerase